VDSTLRKRSISYNDELVNGIKQPLKQLFNSDRFRQSKEQTFIMQSEVFTLQTTVAEFLAKFQL